MIADVVAVRMKLPVVQRRGGEDWRTIAEQFSKRIIDYAEEIGAPEKRFCEWIGADYTP